MRTTIIAAGIMLSLSAAAQQQYIPAYYLPNGTFIPPHYENFSQPSNYSTAVGKYGGSPLQGATMNWQQTDQAIRTNLQAQQMTTEQAMYAARQQAEWERQRANRKWQKRTAHMRSKHERIMHEADMAVERARSEAHRYAVQLAKEAEQAKP